MITLLHPPGFTSARATACVAMLVLGIARAAGAATLVVAADGVDTATCGTKAARCHSISAGAAR